MDVDAGNGCLDGAQNVTVIKRRQAVGKSALDADFSRTHFPGLDRLLRHGFQTVEVAVGFARATAKGAELATDEADVGEVHVAIDDVGDQIADQIAAQRVSGGQQGEKVVAFGICQQQALFGESTLPSWDVMTC